RGTGATAGPALGWRGSTDAAGLTSGTRLWPLPRMRGNPAPFAVRSACSTKTLPYGDPFGNLHGPGTIERKPPKSPLYKPDKEPAVAKEENQRHRWRECFLGLKALGGPRRSAPTLARSSLRGCLRDLLGGRVPSRMGSSDLQTNTPDRGGNAPMLVVRPAGGR